MLSRSYTPLVSQKSFKKRGVSMDVEGVCVFWCVGCVSDVCVSRVVIEFSCHGGQVKAFRGVFEAVGGHSGGQKLSKTIENLSFCRFLENDVFDHPSRSDPLLSSVLDDFWGLLWPL